ncbi:MAG: hypothetical protein EOP51_08380 [Sphingobacteriales bacterium]|nr:MAG: hypothetical protein EOP51_08380 [Sphingobacteriales bacterium]
MQLNEMLISELEKEAASTRKILAAVPNGQYEYKPHEKSMPLGRLATHVAELPIWVSRALGENYDMQGNPLPRPVMDNTEALLAFFEERLTAAKEALNNVTNEQLQEDWSLTRGEHVISKASRFDTMRSWMLNHQVHHRGQLSVYLRLLDVPVPGMYGPSADDILARQAAAEQKA